MVPSTISPVISPDHYVRVTMRVSNPLGVDRRLASYFCYLSQPDIGRSELTTGRYSMTRDSSSSPPSGQRLGSHGLEVELSGSGIDAFGTFYCRGAQQGKDTTTVVGVFLRSDRKWHKYLQWGFQITGV